MFPYDKYLKAVEAESEIRNEGIRAVVLNAEAVENNPECYLLGVETRVTLDEGMLEEGVALKGAETLGDIVAVDTEAGIITIRGSRERMPSKGDEILLEMPDYLRILREFAKELVQNPARRKEERFLGLRDELMMNPGIPDVESDAMAYLRPAQRKALARTELGNFSFVWGPPGTGKSYTLGHIAAHYRAQGKRVLLLSTTNAAVDVATFAIDNACNQVGKPLEEGELIRYSRVLTQKEEYEKRPNLMTYSKLLKRIAQEEKELERKYTEVKRQLEALDPADDEYECAELDLISIEQRIDELRDSWKAEVSRYLVNAKIVCCTIMSCLFNGFAAGRFDVILVDEASQVPLAVWPCLLNAASKKKFVVAGDPMQLAPIEARDPGDEARYWFNHSLYTYLGMGTCRGIEPFRVCGSVTLLNEQTRMRKGICRLVSNLFYNGLLTGDRKDPLPMDVNADIPAGDAVFVDPAEKQEAYGFDRLPTSRMKNTNADSASWVVSQVKRLARKVSAGGKLSILVVTPFRNQASRMYGPVLKRIGKKLDKAVSVAVSTVHRCQGGEADIVFFDLVDPGNWFVNKSESAHLWNVACSRAKHRLVIVGDRQRMWVGTMARQILRQIEVSGRRG